MTPKTWLITGCSSGFGRALAEAALAAGQRVVATARDVRRIADLEQAGRCQVLPLDLTDGADIPRVLEQALAAFDGLDVLVNNAGYGLIGAVEECSEEQARRSLETHFFGPLRLIRAALPHLRARGGGHLVQISAAAAIGNYAGFGVYGAAKAALESLSESLRLELAPFGIQVTLVEPGPFRTDFIRRGLEKAEQPLEAYRNGAAAKFEQFLGRMDGQQPGDPARAATAIVQMVLEGWAPLRLPLGRYAVKKLRDRAAALLREAERAEAVAAATDFPA